ELACRAIDAIQQRNKLPLLVGGSGLYVWSVLEGWGIPQVPPDPEFRHSLEKKATDVGKDEVYQELMKADPVAAQRIDPRNMRRVIRALEVCRSAGAPFSQLQNKEASPFNTLIVGLTADRGELYRRIDLRVDEMIEQGLGARFCRANIHMTVHLSAISAYYLTVKGLSQTKSQLTLTCTSRTNYGYQKIHF
ncbi:unnamed protein product, partial [marine sediment metagenome]